MHTSLTVINEPDRALDILNSFPEYGISYLLDIGVAAHFIDLCQSSKKL